MEESKKEVAPLLTPEQTHELAVKFVELLERQLHPATGPAVEKLVPHALQQPGALRDPGPARASASLSR